MPIVSIVIPVYQAEQWISRCIDSVLTQMYVNYELILVDDGSPDGSGKLCDEYAGRDARIKVIHKKNGGVSSARNAGVDVAQGEYILFVDSDDYLDPDYILRLIGNPSDLTLCGMDIVNEQGNVIRVKRAKSVKYASRHEIDYPFLYRDIWLYSPYCKLFRGDIIRNHQLKFPAGITWGEDGMFVSDYLKYVDTVTMLDYVGYHYVKYESQETLSTKIRDDIVDTISYSREYCIEQMRETAPWHYEEIKVICQKDILSNCGYFLYRLFYDLKRSKKEKTAMFTRFRNNPYVKRICDCPEVCFPNDLIMQSCLKRTSAKEVVGYHNKLWRQQRIRAWIYFRIYLKMPKGAQQICRKIAGK